MPHPTSANGAPLHFEAIDVSVRHGRAQTLSVSAHVVLLALLIFALASPRVRGPALNPTALDSANTLSYIPPLDPHSTAQNPSLGRMGGGGEQDPRPARRGDLAPPSSMPLVPPRLTHEENVALPAPPAVFDPNAPADVTTVQRLGLPWMSTDTDSAGPGKHHGFGSGDSGTMGDGAGNGAGASDSDLPYANVASPVTCLYCPEPPYSEEARKAKLQGKMLLRVLVGPDGKAQRVQIIQGLGMGLDERAEDTVRTWRFSPARDAAKRPIAAWVNIETRFQLF